jgi:hypothetical protein
VGGPGAKKVTGPNAFWDFWGGVFVFPTPLAEKRPKTKNAINKTEEILTLDFVVVSFVNFCRHELRHFFLMVFVNSSGKKNPPNTRQQQNWGGADIGFVVNLFCERPSTWNFC